MNEIIETEQISLTRRILDAFKLDAILLLLLAILAGIGLITLFSASGESVAMMEKQLVRLGIATSLMIIIANIPLRNLHKLSTLFYVGCLLLLLSVMFFGEIGKGAQRWLDLGVLRFQPSELMKLAMPMMLAGYLSQRALPVGWKDLIIAAGLILVPVLLIARQPDLGTALLVGSAGFFVLYLAGVRWKIFIVLGLLVIALAPLLWKFALHDYQRSRILTLFNPERDPLGSGYHIIQSKIAIGSGGLFGKGWLNGTQSQLDFLPERSTDFIFAVYGEEFGLLGSALLIGLYLLIIARGLFIAFKTESCYGRLLAGSLSLTFFVYLFVNIGMVSGILPVVGVPLPLISYGGTSMVTLMAGFGMIMTVGSSKRFLNY